jgi:hypothetical protein
MTDGKKEREEDKSLLIKISIGQAYRKTQNDASYPLTKEVILRKKGLPFFKKHIALFSKTNLPFSEKGCSFLSPPPEWLVTMVLTYQFR